MSAVQETRIYVGNINPDTTKVALKEAFEKVGAVSKLRVLQRRGKTIVYAFITFEAEADAKKAIGDLNETELDGNKIVVEVARPIDEEVLTQRKENRKQNRKLKRQAQQQAKKEEVAAKKEGDDNKKEEAKTTEETETETKPKKKKNNRKRKAKKEEGSEEAQSESTKKDAPAVTKKSPEPAKKEVNKEEDTKAEASKKDKKPEPKKEETAEKNNKTKSTSNKEKTVKSEEKKGEAKEGESKSNRISPETGVFVANLPFSAKTEDLQELFKDFNIKTAKIARGYRSKGYGFVEAATVEDQQKILKEFKEVEFKERLITVKPLLSKGDDE